MERECRKCQRASQTLNAVAYMVVFVDPEHEGVSWPLLFLCVLIATGLALNLTMVSFSCSFFSSFHSLARLTSVQIVSASPDEERK